MISKQLLGLFVLALFSFSAFAQVGTPGPGTDFNELRDLQDNINEDNEVTQRQNRTGLFKQREARKASQGMTDAQMERLKEVVAIYVDLMKQLPSETILANSPYPLAFEALGRTSVRYDMDSDIAGGVGLSLTSKKASKTARKYGARSETISEINIGDVMCLTFWARAGSSKKPSSSASINVLGVGKTSGKDSALMIDTLQLKSRWQHFSYRFIADQSIEAGDAEIFFHIGKQKQVVELGPALLFNLGPVGIEKAKGKACKA